MCGIGIIINGLRLDLSSLFPDYKSPQQQQHLVHNPKISLQHLIQVLKRRGPDHLGTYKLRIQTPQIDDSVAEFHFVGATLQLRGTLPAFQPLVDDFAKNILVYNGEIFGGIDIDSSSNDGKTLLDALGTCCSCNYHEHKAECRGRFSVLELLSVLRGPWALIYWQDISKTLWFGRDAFGRRSLLVHWPTDEDPRFLLSSVSPASHVNVTTDSEVEDQIKDLDFWEELSCGIYSLKLDDSKPNKSLVGEVNKHAWTDPVLNELITWERICVEYSSRELYPLCFSVKKGSTIANPNSASGLASPSEVHSELGELRVEAPASLINGAATHVEVSHPAYKVLIALKGSVMRRAILSPIQEKTVPIAVLFSGGLDSMILAALLDECLDPCYGIDLLNVSFDGQFAPDRISAKAGVIELQRISPSRRWNLVEIDADLSNLTSETEHVMSLINPSKTYMDLNIGIALWLAAGGDGCISNHLEPECLRVKYKSDAKILLVGSGADEQCAGYSRHRTKYRLGGWLGLHEEMKLDMQRIWKRNLGRDDRCISDNGKEARFPFLDEDVIKTLLEIPLWEVADLNLPVGKGDKKILREVAQLLGLKEAAFLPKRAIQFGSRIARESNRKNFGSNRAANQASAGSVEIHKPVNLNDLEPISQ